MEIRKLRQDDDFTDLIALSRDFFEEYSAFDEEFFKIDALRDEDILNYFRGMLQNENGAAFIALEDGAIVGYITVHIREQEPLWAVKMVGAISGLMVRRDHRRRGIARRLAAEAKRFFDERGAEYFTVYTSAANDAAITLYRQCGMTPLYTTLIGKSGA